MPKVTYDTFRHPDTSYRYRLFLDEALEITSGPFLEQRDAESCGAFIATDPEALSLVLKGLST